MIGYRYLLAFLYLVIISFNSQAITKFPYFEEESLQLSIGAIDTVRSQNIERIAVGNEDVISVNILNTEELLIIPLQAGSSDLVIWHKGNRKTMIHINVTEVDPLLIEQQIELIIQGNDKLNLSRTDSHFLLSGEILNQQQLDQLIEQLSKLNLLSMVTLQVNISTQENLTKISALLDHVAGLTFHLQADTISIKGNFDSVFEQHINDVLSRFPNTLNLAIPNPAPQRKMIEIAVQILEIKQRNLERIGIRWQEVLSGPSLAMAQQYTANPFFAGFSNISTSASIVENIPLNDTHFYGAIGMATQIQSQIELLTETGAAKVLAKPMLSTTENASATFHSGGQLPIPVLSTSGEVSVQYQPYGIQLSVLPIIGGDGNIQVEFSAEVSSIDNAIAVNGVPGLAVRQVTSVANTTKGQTIIISGLVSKEDNTSTSKLPFFGNLPLVGRFFRARMQDNSQQELVIMLTPTIRNEGTPGALEKLGQKIQSEF